jgi:hypothetical protein
MTAHRVSHHQGRPWHMLFSARRSRICDQSLRESLARPPSSAVRVAKFASASLSHSTTGGLRMETVPLAHSTDTGQAIR